MPKTKNRPLSLINSKLALRYRLALSLTAVSLIILSLSARRVNTNRGNVRKVSGPSPSETYLDELLKDPSTSESWLKLLDPSQQEFWREGSHIPDAGFLKFATDPTIQNAKLYLIRMNAKRDRLHLMYRLQAEANQELIEAKLIADDYDFLKSASQVSPAPGGDFQKELLDPASTQIWFYFDPACPYCQKQGETLKGQTNVIPVQVKGDNLHYFEGLSPSVWADKEDLKLYVRDGKLPVLVVYAAKNDQLGVLTGLKSIKSIKLAINELNSKTKKGKPHVSK